VIGSENGSKMVQFRAAVRWVVVSWVGMEAKDDGYKNQQSLLILGMGMEA